MSAWNDRDTLLLGLTIAAQLAVIALVAFAAGRLTRRNGVLRYSFYVGALLLMLLSPALAIIGQRCEIAFFAVPVEADDPLGRAASSPRDPGDASGGTIEFVSLPASTNRPWSGETTFTFAAGFPAAGRPSEAGASSVALPPTSLPPEESDSHVFVLHFALAVWGAGVVFLLARLLAAYRSLRRIRRDAVPLASRHLEPLRDWLKSAFADRPIPPIVTSNLAPTPISFGFVRPLVVLPHGLIDCLEREQLRQIIAHEVAHVVRRDQWMLFLERIVGALFWPHVVVHALQRAIDRAREEICDNFVLRFFDAASYSRTLLFVTEWSARRPQPSLAAGLLKRRKLETRIAGLLDGRRVLMTRPYRSTVFSLVLGLTLLSTLLLGAGVRTESDPPEPADPSGEGAANAEPPNDPSALPAESVRDEILLAAGVLSETLLGGGESQTNEAPEEGVEGPSAKKKTATSPEDSEPKEGAPDQPGKANDSAEEELNAEIERYFWRVLDSSGDADENSNKLTLQRFALDLTGLPGTADDFQTFPVPEGAKSLKDWLYRDVDGDGKLDLILSHGSPDGTAFGSDPERMYRDWIIRSNTQGWQQVFGRPNEYGWTTKLVYEPRLLSGTSVSGEWIQVSDPALVSALGGAQLRPLDALLRSQLELPEGQGLSVAALTEDGAAANSGFRANDILVSVDGRPLRRPAELLEASRSGQTPTIHVVRDGARLELLWRVPPVEPPKMEDHVEQPYWIGVRVERVHATTRRQLGLEEREYCYLSAVVSNGPAERAGLKVHDIVVSGDGTSITNLKELRDYVVASEGKAILLKIRRGGRLLFVSVVPEKPAATRPSTDTEPESAGVEGAAATN